MQEDNSVAMQKVLLQRFVFLGINMWFEASSRRTRRMCHYAQIILSFIDL